MLIIRATVEPTTKGGTMRKQALLVTLATLTAILAGCTDSGSQKTTGPTAVSGCVGEECSEFKLSEGQGAITGLVIDDRLRPLEGSHILLLPLGLDTISNDNGEFGFVGLKPGIYTVKVQKDKHEAAPKRVDVVAGQYAEAIVEARRTVSENSIILTQEFSVFIPCNVMAIYTGIVSNCVSDTSGENYRPGFTSDYSDFEDVTYLVTEMKANQADAYNVQVRIDNTYRYAAKTSFDPVEYMRIALEKGVVNPDADYFGGAHPWENDGSFMTILFVMENFAREMNSLGFSTGVGATLGIKAQFVQSVFIGEPEVDIDTYAVLA